MPGATNSTAASSVHLANLSGGERELGVPNVRDVLELNRALTERLSDRADLIADPQVPFQAVCQRTHPAVRSTPIP